MENQKEFETERLILRPTNEDDAAFFLELVNTKKWIENIGDRNIKSVKDAKDYINSKMKPQLERLGFSNYTIIRKEDKAKIGTCGLYDRDGLEGIDIGFALLPQFENMGYALESSLKVKEVGVNVFKLKKISAITTKNNLQSQKLIKKLGLTYIKTIRIPNDDEELLYFCVDC